jgi:predicted N-formylglutamate amidohydrolase
LTIVLESLLTGEDPQPVLPGPARAASPWLLVVDHAGNAVPRSLRGLGVAPSDLADHIGIDIGIWPVSQRVAADLGAPAIGQAYSRLVIDCNRQPGTPTCIPTMSDGRDIPGNRNADAPPRVAEIFLPYHAAIDAELARQPLLCAMHSFTRVLGGRRRSVDIGVIHGPSSRLADAILQGLAGSGLDVQRNAPYQIDFNGDYTLPVHGEGRGLDYVEIEICQDLIKDAAGQTKLATLMSQALRQAQDSLS